MDKLYYVRFAQAYGEGAYSNCNYSDSTTCTTTGGGTSNDSGSGSNADGALSNTGLMIALVVAIACLVIFVALVVRFWRRPARQEVRAEDFVPQRPGQNDESGAPHDRNFD